MTQLFILRYLSSFRKWADMNGLIRGGAGILIRTFICIRIPDHQLKILSKWINARRHESNDVHWVEPETMHITLKFCGENLSGVIQMLSDKLMNIQQRGPFSLYLEGLGGFPDLIKPRVIWAGINGDIKRLKDIRSDVEAAALKASIPREEKTYNPHLTLGRRSSELPLPIAAKTKMEACQLLLDPWTVNEIVLMRSELSYLGPRYTPLGLFKI